MAIHLPIGSVKTCSVLEPDTDANPVPTSPLANDITTVPSGPVIVVNPKTGVNKH